MLMDFRAAAFVVLIVAFIYFFQRSLRLALRLYSKRVDELDARTAPTGLGLNREQTDFHEHADDDDV
jgi:hypothetical protein